MPDHKLHITVDLIFLGKEFPEVHKFMDMFQPILQSNHRAINHDMETVMKIAEENGGEAAMSAYLHIMLDKISDEVGQERAVYELIKRLIT